MFERKIAEELNEKDEQMNSVKHIFWLPQKRLVTMHTIFAIFDGKYFPPNTFIIHATTVAETVFRC